MAGRDHPEFGTRLQVSSAVDRAGHRLHDRRRPRQSPAYRLLTTILDPEQADARTWPPPMRNAGKSRAPSTNSKPINAGRGQYCARSHPSWYSRRSGDTCAATTPSAPSCSTPQPTLGTTRTEYPSSRRYESLEDRCRTALFPPHNDNAAATLWRCAIGKLVQRLNPARRTRANPRVVKRKVLKWSAKRSHHTRWPQPAYKQQISIHPRC